MGRKLGRPLIAPRERRQKFQTTVSPRMMAIAEQVIAAKVGCTNLADFMDWAEGPIEEALGKLGVKLESLPVRQR